MNSRKGRRTRKRERRKPYWRMILGIVVVVVLILVLVLAVWTSRTRTDGQASDGAVDETVTEENLPEANLELEDRTEAPYEHWLSAAVLTGISIEYPAFEPGEFYMAGETSLDNHEDSAGVYVTFSVDGEAMCIHAIPLDGERSDIGTKDVYSEAVGFATFEEVDPAAIPEEFSAVDVENMDELITQSTRVAVYAH